MHSARKTTNPDKERRRKINPVSPKSKALVSELSKKNFQTNSRHVVVLSIVISTTMLPAIKCVCEPINVRRTRTDHNTKIVHNGHSELFRISSKI
jgi:hypothetical protein